MSRWEQREKKRQAKRARIPKHGRVSTGVQNAQASRVPRAVRRKVGA